MRKNKLNKCGGKYGVNTARDNLRLIHLLCMLNLMDD